MKILVFGNQLIEEDNLPLKILPEIQKQFPEIEFKEIDSTENLQGEADKNKNLIIMDTVQNTDEIRVIKLETQEDFAKLELPKSLSMHDFDLAYNLRLLKKIDLINNVAIICIPMNAKEKETLSQLQLIFKKWVAQLMQGS